MSSTPRPGGRAARSPKRWRRTGLISRNLPIQARFAGLVLARDDRLMRQRAERLRHGLRLIRQIGIACAQEPVDLRQLEDVDDAVEDAAAGDAAAVPAIKVKPIRAGDALVVRDWCGLA